MSGHVDAPVEDARRATDLERLERERRERGEPFARATVVRREPPVSARVGDRALIDAAGEIVGWIGGAACAQSVVSEVGRRVIEEGAATLVGIAPDPSTVERPGLEAYPMTCHSEGTLEVFIEPVVDRPTLLLVGASPVVVSLARMARELPFAVHVVDPDGGEAFPETVAVTTSLDPATIVEAVSPAPLVVVASMGAYDDRGIAAGVLAEAPYIGLVASATRAERERKRAAERADVEPATVAEAVTSPAGVDVGAQSPPEIAASILAELVAVRPAGTGDSPGQAAPASANLEPADDGEPDGEGTATSVPIDPVCGMAVEPAEAAASVEHDGTTYHFCCPGCAERFRGEPTAYLEEAAVETDAD